MVARPGLLVPLSPGSQTQHPATDPVQLLVQFDSRHPGSLHPPVLCPNPRQHNQHDLADSFGRPGLAAHSAPWYRSFGRDLADSFGRPGPPAPSAPWYSSFGLITSNPPPPELSSLHQPRRRTLALQRTHGSGPQATTTHLRDREQFQDPMSPQTLWARFHSGYVYPNRFPIHLWLVPASSPSAKVVQS